jgi:UDP-N-acetylmuramoyl-L-alanyl-D-glutamate--2,6-diaminopimelate ligase
MQRLGEGSPLVVVDYAHTPDALASTERAARLRRAGRRAGGACSAAAARDRDRGKRPEMGRVAARLADRVIVTSDNPAAQDPGAIASDIVHGIRRYRQPPLRGGS